MTTTERTPAQIVEADITRKINDAGESFVDAARSIIRALEQQIESVNAGYAPRDPLGSDVTRLHDATTAWRLHNETLMTIQWMNDKN